MSYIKLVKGDDRTVLTASIIDDATKLPANMQGAIVTLSMRQADSTTTLFAVVGDLLPGYVNDSSNVDTTVYTTPGSGGRVEFQFPAGSLDIAAGNYEGEITIAYAGGGSQTVYDLVKFLVRE